MMLSILLQGGMAAAFGIIPLFAILVGALFWAFVFSALANKAGKGSGRFHYFRGLSYFFQAIFLLVLLVFIGLLISNPQFD